MSDREPFSITRRWTLFPSRKHATVGLLVRALTRPVRCGCRRWLWVGPRFMLCTQHVKEALRLTESREGKSNG